jgi:hypothetical protein
MVRDILFGCCAIVVAEIHHHGWYDQSVAYLHFANTHRRKKVLRHILPPFLGKLSLCHQQKK